jgi:metal-responsive CopG/Arc/MetJ family transcriptional regulator
LPKFIVKKPEKEVISLRLDSDLLKTIDEKSAIYEISRNELINQMITFALDNMQEETK